MKKKFITRIIIISLIICSIKCNYDNVYALSAGGLKTTIASIIVSLMVEAGVAPVNQSWLNTLNSSYGVESSIGTLENAIQNGLLTETASGLVDTGLSSAIESSSAYSELGIGEIFSTTNTMEGVAAASGGVNLANTAINCGTLGTIGAFAGAISIGVGIGVLVNNLRENIGSYIKYGIPFSKETRNSIANNIPDGFDRCYYITRKNGNTYYSSYYFVKGNSDIEAYYKPVGNPNGAFTSNIFNVNSNSNNLQNRLIQYTNSYKSSENDFNTIVDSPGMTNSSGNRLVDCNFNIFDNSTLAGNYRNDVVNGIVIPEKIISKDIIGKEGNQFAEGQIQNVVPDGYDMSPIDWEDYQEFADLANENTEEGLTGAEQSTAFEDLIDDNLIVPSMIPDIGINDPEVPDRPIIPDQPVITDKEEPNQGTVEEVLSGMTTVDLRSVFPFCIPFDLYALVKEFDEREREAPYIYFEFPKIFESFNKTNEWKIEIDLSEYEDVASLLRRLELMLFIIGLAVITKNIIG